MSFNSRPHEEVDFPISTAISFIGFFQFTTSRGGRHYYLTQINADYTFQFTTSRGGRQYYGSGGSCQEFFQFTTSRGGRLKRGVGKPAFYHLSIHDLTRRSTLSGDLVHHTGFSLSIHDLTRRSTAMVHLKELSIRLSIHDLTRRSTACSVACSGSPGSFNSRPHEEVDVLLLHTLSSILAFQFTTSRGGRQEHILC